jgi:L-cysteine:1D-myo-inositol 2-amino-2-deoxy-alpha-D-glucopyranoside ligase
MKLYNTLTQQTEPLQIHNNRVTLYVCGITPYDTTHLGHAATYCAFDLLVRYLELQGVTVVYTQNVTDIDDDTLREGNKRGEDWRALGNRWTAHFIRDLTRLNVRPPDFYPRATDVIPQIVANVRTLVERGAAYVANGSVYYHIDVFRDFGALSHIPRGEMLPIANERGNFPDDPNKRDPLDFVLWQAQKQGEPAWESPWSPGRPGWHIECSTMARQFLGATIDIHGGGADLVFPHHECEIAQSVVFNQTAYFARYWMHIAMVHYQGEKMSKSLGNLVMVDDLLKTFSADAIRFFLATKHYRAIWTFEMAEMENAAARVKMLEAANRCASGTGNALDATRAREEFVAALDNDLDAPGATCILEKLADEIIRASAAGRDVRAAQQHLRDYARVLGLRLGADSPEERVTRGWGEHLKRFV